MENGFKVQYRKMQQPYTMSKNHIHDYYEIYYLLAGEREYFIKDRTYRVRKGDLVFINKYDLHKTAAANPPEHERIVINFEEEFIGNFRDEAMPDLLSPFMGDTKIVTLEPDDQSFVKLLLYNMLREKLEQRAQFETYLRTLLIQLLIFSRRRIEQMKPKFEYSSPLHQKISEMMYFINKHHSQTLTLSIISQQFYMSPHYISRAFKRVTGFSFVEYLNTVRIKEAQRLLRESDLNVTAIGGRVGFESIAHFSRVFKKTTNLSPLQYRKSTNVK